MKWLQKIVLLLLLPTANCLLPICASAQLLDSAALHASPVYKNLEEALKNPDQVYRLDLRSKNLKTFPIEILKFKNLQELNLSKNKLKQLPEGIGELTNLQKLDIASNKIDSFPDSIGKLKNLKKLLAGKNNIMVLPAQFGDLENLEVLDLWSNDIDTFPNEMGKLKKLRWMDLRVIMINDDVQQHLKELLPNTIIHFSPSCHCVSG